jgi:GAF domain-containing protein/anti-sigma regulatory factor (Ser/Thr protein kinase)
MARLQAVTATFSESLTSADVMDVVVEQVVSSFGARAGLVATVTETGEDLVVVRQTGYPDWIITTWRVFPINASFPLSDTVREMKPIFMENGEAFWSRYPDLAAEIDKADQAAAALPLIAGGRRIGGLYLTYPGPRPFSEDDQKFLMSLAHQCAQALARAQLYEDAQAARAAAEAAVAQLQAEIEVRRRSETLAAAQAKILEQIAHGNPLMEILTSIACLIDSQVPDICSAISMFDSSIGGLRLAAGPGLPPVYAAALAEGFPVGPEIGSCGSAAFHKKSVFTTDIATDSRWQKAGALPLEHGLRACWSTPILGKNDQVLGTFGLFYRRIIADESTRRRDQEFVEVAVHLAGIAIERDRVDAGRRAFLAESLAMVTEGHLLLCRAYEDLPRPRPDTTEALPVSNQTMAELRGRIRAAAMECGFSQARCDDLLTGATEAAANTITHAAGKGSAWVHADAAVGRVYVWIVDDGPGIEDDALHHATLERGWTTAGTLGHGFWIMLRMIDCTFLLTGPTGTTVVLEQKRTPSTPDWLTK